MYPEKLNEKEVLDFFYSYMGKMKKMILLTKKLKTEIPEDLRVYYKERLCLLDMYRKKIEKMTKTKNRMEDEDFEKMTDMFLDYIERQSFYVDNLNGKDVVRISTDNYNISLPFWLLLDLVNIIDLISEYDKKLLLKDKSRDVYNLLKKIQLRIKRLWR